MNAEHGKNKLANIVALKEGLWTVYDRRLWTVRFWFRKTKPPRSTRILIFSVEFCYKES